MSEFDEQIRGRVRAMPGTLTYVDLIRKNKRDSVFLILGMFLLTGVVFGVVGAAISARFGGFNAEARGVLLTSAAVGVAVGLVTATIGTIWSWFGGANAILRMTHAKEITPELDAELFNVVDEMRIAAGLPMPKVYLIGDSALNAFATGRDPEHAAIGITTGLRTRLSRDELQGVIAHEMAHVRHLDIRFSLLMATMVGLVAFACDAFLRSMWYGGMRTGGSRGGGNKGGGQAAIILFVIGIVLAIVAPIAARIIQMGYSRRREYLADAGAVELTRNPEGLANALRALREDREPFVDTANRGTAHMFITNPLRKGKASKAEKGSLFSSHPPLTERIARLEALLR